jgi:transposase
MNDIKYAAADVHKATTTFTVRNAEGKITTRATVETKAQDLIAFVRAIPGTVHLTFEEGTQAAWLYETLRPRVAELVVCDPRKNKLLAHGNKSDTIDTDKLSELLRGGFLTSVYHGENGTRELRSFVRAYEKLVDDSVRQMNQVKAVFRGRGIPTPGSDVYQADGREAWLSQLPSQSLRHYAGCSLRQLDLAADLRDESEKLMLAEARRQPAWRKLTAVPGIGPIRAATIIGVLGSPHRFRTKRQLWSYCGLAVVTRSSADYDALQGTLKRKTRASTRGLNRNHNPIMKDVFKGAAIDAIRSSFADFNARLVASGMREEMARLTVARKIVAIVLTIWKKGETYNPTKALMTRTR